MLSEEKEQRLQNIKSDLLNNRGNKKSLFGDTSDIDENNNELEQKLEEEEIQKNKEQVERRQLERRQLEEMQRKQKEDERKRLMDIEFRKQLDEYEATKRKKNEAITRKKEATKRKKLRLNNKTKKNKQKEIQMKQMNGPSEDISTAEFEKLMPKPKPPKPPIEAGFRKTLRKTKKIVKPINANPNIICKAILQSGKNITKKKYYLPSQFPNLTKLKPVIKPKTEEKPK